jgi:hypothetical protein
MILSMIPLFLDNSNFHIFFSIFLNKLTERRNLLIYYHFQIFYLKILLKTEFGAQLQFVVLCF